jgi:hypothetical protein
MALFTTVEYTNLHVVYSLTEMLELHQGNTGIGIQITGNPTDIGLQQYTTV